MTEIKIIEFRLFPGHKAIKAFADVKIGDIIIRDFRVMKEDGQRPYVKAPFVVYKDQMGKLKFRQIAILPDEIQGEIDLLILNTYLAERERDNGKEKR
jgi:hypothetical protein